MIKPIYIIFLLTILTGCSSESCRIDFDNNSEIYSFALEEIFAMNLKMDSEEPFRRPILLIYEKDSLVNSEVFSEIEFIECHEDSTIIFQAPNCDGQSDFRDVVYFLAYSPKGPEHIKRKRNIGKIKKVKENWYLCKHIESIAN